MHLKFIFITLLLITSKVSFSQNIFDLGVRQIEIFFSQSNWDDSLHYYYSSGQRLIADSIIIDGEVDELVGVRYKGGDSYSSNNIKNPLNISLDYVNNGQSIDGYNTLKLSNGFHDPTFVREMLSYEIARNYMPAPKSTYANVFINGNQIGLYVCVQSIDDDFTNENFYERKGPFFKADVTNFQAPGCPSTQAGIWEFFTDTLCYQTIYEMQSSNDWSKLSDFLDTVNNHFANVEEVLDIDRTLWMMAFQNLFVCLNSPINSIPKNFYLFKDNNRRFSPILWNMNQSFGIFTNGLPSPVNNQDLQQLDIFHSSSNNQNIMTSKIFSSNRYKKMYVAHMRTIVNEHLANNNYYNRALVFQQLIDNNMPITLTSSEITRYFMTIPEACSLVLDASTFGENSQIFVFDMGKPVKILDLAKKMLLLNGLNPEVEDHIKYIGLRPGEKLTEELLTKSDNCLPTHNEKLYVAIPNDFKSSNILSGYNSLKKHIELNSDNYTIVKILKDNIPEFKSNNSVFTSLD